MDCSIQGSSAFHYLQKFAKIHVHWFGSTIYPSHSIPLLFCLQSCLFQMRWLLTSGGQSMRATAPVFPMIILGWFPLELTGLISLQSKRLSRVFSIQFSSGAPPCLTLCDPMNCSTPGLPVHHQFLEFTQTHLHQVSDAIQTSHPLSSPFPPNPNPSKHQGLFQWINSSHEVTKVLEFQL